MKGHMQDGKFHPHTDYIKGVRKSRDQSIKTTGVKVERKAREVIFQDDPNAIPKLEQKLQDLEKQRAYWKTIKKTVPRDYSATEGDRKWFMPQNINANIRTVKKKLEVIKNRKEKNIGLERKTTFKNGRKVFYYEEVEPVGKVRKARDFLKEQEEEENKTIAKFEHADRRTGFRGMHLGDFRLITIYPEREDFYECKICGGLEAID